MRVPGPRLDDLAELGDRYAAIVTDAARAVLEQQARRLGTDATLDDLKFITTRWPAYVDDTLIPELAASLWHGVDVVHGGLARGAAALTAAVAVPDLPSLFADLPGPDAPPGWPPTSTAFPRVSSPTAQAYLANRKNALVGIGDHLWSKARDELSAGQQAGEGVALLKQRVLNSLDVSAPRAQAIARTEVNGAANAGSLLEALATGMTGTKEWIATPGSRTRKDHAHADGQKVALDAKFTVGGHAMAGPHDQLGPASQVVNCRCTLGYDFDDDEVAATVAAVPMTDLDPKTLIKSTTLKDKKSIGFASPKIVDIIVPKIDGTTTSLNDVLAAYDKYHKLNPAAPGSYSYKVTHWFKTANGKKYAADHGIPTKWDDVPVKVKSKPSPPKPKPAPKPTLTAVDTGFPERTDAFMTKMQKSMKTWSPSERAALVRYTSSAYREINGVLRGRLADSLTIRKLAAKIVAGMAPTTENVLVRRGVGLDAFGLGHTGGARALAGLRKLVGTTFDDAGFSSTSIKRPFGGDVVMNIKVPKGTPAAYVESITRYKGEYELLLPPGTKFKVNAVRQSGGRYELDVEVIP